MVSWFQKFYVKQSGWGNQYQLFEELLHVLVKMDQRMLFCCGKNAYLHYITPKWRDKDTDETIEPLPIKIIYRIKSTVVLVFAFKIVLKFAFVSTKILFLQVLNNRLINRGILCTCI